MRTQRSMLSVSLTLSVGIFPFSYPEMCKSNVGGTTKVFQFHTLKPQFLLSPKITKKNNSFLVFGEFSKSILEPELCFIHQR